MTFSASSMPALVATARPVGQPPILRHSVMMVEPPTRWIAPSTPPPPASCALAALTIASTCCLVMSPSTSSIVEVPTAILNVILSFGSPGERVTIATRVGRGRLHTRGPIDRYDRRRARVTPSTDHLDHVPSRPQRLDHVGRHTPFHAQLARTDPM